MWISLIIRWLFLPDNPSNKQPTWQISGPHRPWDHDQMECWQRDSSASGVEDILKDRCHLNWCCRSFIFMFLVYRQPTFIWKSYHNQCLITHTRNYLCLEIFIPSVVTPSTFVQTNTHEINTSEPSFRKKFVRFVKVFLTVGH